jgi:hypothetical protein
MARNGHATLLGDVLFRGQSGKTVLAVSFPVLTAAQLQWLARLFTA